MKMEKKDQKKLTSDKQEIYLEEINLNERYKKQVILAEYISIAAAISCCITSIVLVFANESAAALALFTGKTYHQLKQSLISFHSKRPHIPSIL
jgi:hypothetical protein